MSEILRNKGIICFLVFIVGVSFMSTNSFNIKEGHNDDQENYISIQDEI
jgi:hypothetical protein